MTPLGRALEDLYRANNRAKQIRDASSPAASAVHEQIDMALDEVLDLTRVPSQAQA